MSAPPPPELPCHPAGPALRAPLVALLRGDIDANVYLLGVLARTAPGEALSADGEFLIPGDGWLDAVIYRSQSGLVVPYGAPWRVRSLAAALPEPPRLVVGLAPHVDALRDGLGPRAPNGLDRAQRLYRLTRVALPPALDLTVRRAGPADVDDVCDVVAAMQAEEFGTDPARYATAAFRARIQRLVADGRSFIARERGQIVFHVSANSQSPDGAQIEAVWTAPWRRRAGLAHAALAQVCQRLLAELPRVVLGVAVDNTPAVRLYERLGFTPVADLRLLLADGPARAAKAA